MNPRLTGNDLAAQYVRQWRATREGEPPVIVHTGNGRFELYDRPGASPRRMNAEDVRGAIENMRNER